MKRNDAEQIGKPSIVRASYFRSPSSGTDDGPGFAGAQSEQARRSAGDKQYYIQIVQPGGGQLSLHSQVMTSSIRMSNVSAGTSSTI